MNMAPLQSVSNTATSAMAGPSVCRHLVLVLGDQLGWDNPALDGFDPLQDRLLLIEADSEAK